MPAAVGRLPHRPGVYRFLDGRNTILYIGRAADLRRRVASYWGDLGERSHLARMVGSVQRVQAVICASEHEATWLERNLLEQRKPRANRTTGGQEVPALIGLGPGGLKALHWPCGGAWQYFGPYLGGDRLRLALSGINRIYPASLFARGATAGERELARVRGAAGVSRADAVQAVSCVLERDPAAVAALEAELVRHRDRAAGALAFELARRVQDEIEAVKWLVSPQRVTALERYDLDAYGWEGGRLVHFAVRDGRLSTWRERTTGARAAARLRAVTPAAWAEFAQENARLAALLAEASV